VLQELHVDPPLDPPIEGERANTDPYIPVHTPLKEAIDATPPFRPSQLATSYLRTAHIHKEHVASTLNSLRYQHEALRIASTSLDLNVLAIMDVFEGISQSAQKDLEKQEALLAAVDADLEIISRVKIHVEFMSPATRKAVEAGEKARTLGDYVSNLKMKQVAETCARTHGDLRSTFTRVEDAVSKLNYGTDEVRAVASATGYACSTSDFVIRCLTLP
jgi:autophagy-related protein 11